MRISCMVVLYNPDIQVLENILTYVDYFQHFYIIDNSTQPIDWLESIISKSNVTYINMHGNQGIASALNAGVKQAVLDKSEVLMTMDQDSRFERFTLEGYIKQADEILEKDRKVAVIGINYDGYMEKTKNKDIEIADEVITSGMILNLPIMSIVGNFVEKLFIDYVDYEYCYRVRSRGYRCIILKKYKLQHQIGGMHPIVKFGINFRNHNEHNAIRQYYMARNVIYIIKSYPFMAAKWIKNLIKAPIKIILVDDDKFNKMNAYFEGIFDGIRGHYGPKTFSGR